METVDKIYEEASKFLISDEEVQEQIKRSIERGTEPRIAEFTAKLEQLLGEVDFWMCSLREKSDDEWQMSETWHEVVDACYKFKKFNRQFYSTGKVPRIENL